MTTGRTDATVAEQIRRARREQGLSANQLAKLVGVAASTITRLEKGTIDPRQDLVERIATALGLPPIQLLTPQKLGKRLLDAPAAGATERKVYASSAVDTAFGGDTLQRYPEHVVTISPPTDLQPQLGDDAFGVLL